MNKFNIKLASVLVFVLLIGGLFIKTDKVSASEVTLTSENFIVWNQGELKGYDVGFKIEGSTFDNASSIIIKLYSSNTLLQTNTALPNKIKGNQFLTPFDVLGSFNYTKDGNFINTRASEYGKTLIPTKVIATVTMNDGRVLTVTNASLTGDTSTIVAGGKVLGASKYNFTQKLKVGSNGNEVTELQKYLNASGYNCGVADGSFGTKTKTAVAKLQVANSLKGDGVVGPITRVILNK